jgi:hypothetical protein
MTTFATGAEVKVNLVAETTPGTTPATPTMIQIPFVKIDVDQTQTTYEDNSVYADRMERYAIAGLRKPAGTLSGNLSHTNFSPIIQTAMFNTWSSNVIKTGTTLQTVTLEKWHVDIAKGFIITGAFADKISFKLPVAGLVTFDATIAGFNVTTETTALSASPTVPVAEQPYTVVNATLVKEGGSAIATLTGVDFSIDNKATALDVFGSQVPVGYVAGMSKITGTATAYVTDLSLYAKFAGQTGTSLEVTLTDGTNTFDILFPNIVYTAAKIPVQGQGAIVQSLSFTALRDPTALSNIVITRS